MQLAPAGAEVLEEFLGKEDYSTELLGSEVVGDWMTPRVISVPPEVTLRKVDLTLELQVLSFYQQRVDRGREIDRT